MLAGVWGVEEGAVTVPRGSLEDGFFWGVEPDDVAEVAEEEAVLWADDDAAAGGDDVAGLGLLGEFEELDGFEFAEGVLAFFCEDFGDFFTEGLLDEEVGVCEGVAEALVELAADGGFPAAHEADKNDVLGGDFCLIHGGEVTWKGCGLGRGKVGIGSGEACRWGKGFYSVGVCLNLW